ncbi:MAG: adenylate/guanylate cyclase domain-containing protein [Bacteroidota bacterium]
MQLEILLDITNSINHNFSTLAIVEKFKRFVKEQLNIEKLVLFSKFSQWRCLLSYGLEEGELDKIEVERDLLYLKEITSVISHQNDALKNFDMVVPVYQGEKPLAYLLLGDVNNDALSVSHIIKHLNFLQLLTNISVSAIENQRLSKEVLKQEQKRRELIEKQNEILEGLVQERTKELYAEKNESERLLHNILPKEVAEELKQKGFTTPLRHSETTIIFTDFKGFTATAARISPQKLVNELNDIFKTFDFIMEKNGIEKIKTIGDSYMAVCGLPKKSNAHAIQCIIAAFDMIEFLEKRKISSDIAWEMRVGIHSGPLVAGVVGAKKFTYDVWGDTVNTASRMESNGISGKVNISEKTFLLVKNYFDCEYRGKLAAKGKGEMDMYFVTKEKVSERFLKVKDFILNKLKNELPENLYYHGLHHTIDVYCAATMLALSENIDKENIELIKVASLFHDTGFIKQYKENEIIGCESAREILPRFGFLSTEIESICGMIMATKIPQTPKNHIEKILADADLDYLGRTDYYSTGKTLFDELNANGIFFDEKQWKQMQIKFLSNHKYFTMTARELREPEKQKQLEKIKQM